jgi:ribosomal protein L11 methyltransferase
VEVREGELTASFPTGEAARVVAAEVGGRVVEVDGAWADAWRRFAQPVEVGETLVVVPAWQTVPVGDRLALEIDPGACFGSGTHPSTRLLLKLLVEQPPEGLRVLDVGTGSGILAVAAARLGAGSVTAIDVDPAAVAITNANAARNAVANRIHASTSPVAKVGARFDLALINVTAGVHAELGAEVAAAVRPQGQLWLAGLLPGQWRHIQDAYPGCRTATRLELDGWTGAALVRK